MDQQQQSVFLKENTDIRKPTFVRCRKCRQELYNYSVSTNVEEPDNLSDTSITDEIISIPQTQIPDWMKDEIDLGEWTKGKLTCPKCKARIGSYNFICSSGKKSFSKSHLNTSTPIYLVQSKVDLMFNQ